MKMIRQYLVQIASALLLLPFGALPGTGAPSGAASTAPITHVFVIVMENHSYNQVWGTSSTPYITSLGKAYARASSYYATTHPSLPNYLDMIAGSNYGITTDCSPSSSCHIKARNLADLLQAKGLRWKAYMESMPAPCGLKSSGQYAPKHDPFVYFDDIRTNSTRCKSHVVPFISFSSDIQSLTRTPNFAFISPNQCNDMHNCSIHTGDIWLKNHVPTILKSPACVQAKCLVVITWDEDNGHSGNHVLTIFAGSGAKTGGVSSGSRFNHYSLLRTIESIFHVATQTTKDGSATTMTSLLR
jgi:acid phosphatase